MRRNQVENVIKTKKRESIEVVHTHTHTHTHTISLKKEKGITLIALVITIIFSYDENLKSSNNKGFLLQSI